jgi:hypothetical protein
VAGLFIVGIFAFNYVIMPVLVRQGNAVIVPDLRNASEAEAKQRSRGSGSCCASIAAITMAGAGGIHPVAVPRPTRT